MGLLILTLLGLPATLFFIFGVILTILHFLDEDECIIVKIICFVIGCCIIFSSQFIFGYIIHLSNMY